MTIPGERAVGETAVADRLYQPISLTLPTVNVGINVYPFLLDDGTLTQAASRIYKDKTPIPIYADRTDPLRIYVVN